MDECALEKITKEAIRFVSESDPKLVSIERRKNLLKARIMAKQLEVQERTLHEGLPESVEKEVRGKKVLLWQKLLEQHGYDDMEVVRFMKEGVPLVGSHDHLPCYPLKIKMASTTEAELRSMAVPCRLALENRRPQTDAPGFAEHLEETASEEVSLRFLEGPSRLTPRPSDSTSRMQITWWPSHWSLERRRDLIGLAKRWTCPKHTNNSQSCPATETWLLCFSEAVGDVPGTTSQSSNDSNVWIHCSSLCIQPS